MQDSIELPDSSFNSSLNDRPEQFPEEINFCISPNISAKKNILTHNASEESLAYSTSTKMFGINTERSPLGLNFGLETSHKKNAEKNMIIGMYAAKDFPIALEEQQRSQKRNNDRQQIRGENNNMNRLENKTAEDRRKTINKMGVNHSVALSRQKKQLQYALQLQMMTSEELRTKVAILSQLLEDNIKNSEFSYILKLKNSSNMKNIDIFVEMKRNSRKLKQAELLLDQQNIEIIKLKQQIRQYTDKQYKKKHPLSPETVSFNKQNFNTSNGDQNASQIYRKQIQLLEQEKQSLFSYVEELKQQFNQEIKINQELKSEIERHQQKQQKWVNNERPKLCLQLNEKSEKIHLLSQEIEKLKMEINLIQLTQQNQSENMHHHQKSCLSPQKSQLTFLDAETQTQRDQKAKTIRSMSVQAGSPTQIDALFSQLDFLKTERQHYKNKYKKAIEDIGEKHRLKLELASAKTQLQQLYANK